ncbi:MAG: ImmA/IrrE family metallo-endopeptidase [Rhodospirillaceae bacterium]
MAIRSDDSTLDAESRRVVEERARKLLDRAAAWGQFPTPVDDILAAAKIKIAPRSVFDPRRLLEYARARTEGAVDLIKTAISKIFGVCDSEENVIHIDHEVTESKQRFLKLHETGHHEMPTHRKLFKFFMDCEKTLAPEIADLFEREANNFARFAIFQGDAYVRRAADEEFGIKTPIKLAKVFGASIYASSREFVRTNHRACAVYILEPVELVVTSQKSLEAA